MKRYLFFILLVSSFAILYANNESERIVKNVSISKDTTIYFEDHFSDITYMGKFQKNDSKWIGDRRSSVLGEMNSDSTLCSWLSYNDDKKSIKLEIKYDLLKEKGKACYTVKEIYWDTEENKWVDKQRYYLEVIPTLTLEQKKPKTEVDSIPEVNGGKQSDDSHVNESTPSYIWIGVSALCLIILLQFILYGRNSRRISAMEDKMDFIASKPKEHRPVVDTKLIEKNILSKISSDYIVQTLDNNDIHKLLSKPEAQKYILTIVRQLVEQILPPYLETIKKNKDEEEPEEQDEKKLEERNAIMPSAEPTVSPRLTQYVTYRGDTHTFVLSDKMEYFRVYVEDGDYYYTLVDDPAVRQQFLGSIGGFSKCVTITGRVPMPSIVEPVTPGRLFHTGNNGVFMIDTNNILQVELK